MTEETSVNNSGHEGILVEIDNYAEEAPLTYLFGDSARVKIIGAFVAESGITISAFQISHVLLESLAAPSIRILIRSKKLGVIEHSRDIENGHSPLYQLNDDSDIAELCYKLEGRFSMN